MTNSAKVYGSSLYDLAQEENCVEELQESLTQVRSLFREAPEYLHLLSEPSIPLKERQKLIVDALFGENGGEEALRSTDGENSLQPADHYLVNFLKLLCERGILKDFYGCCDEFVRRYRADRNIASAVVLSAVPLSESQQKALREKLEKVSKKKVLMSVKTDPSVIGGLKVELDGKEMDGSVQGRLEGISRRLSDINL